MNYPVSAYSVAAVRELDRRAIAALDGNGHALMTTAATAAYRRLRARWPEAKRLVVACGRGNNGGDGYVLARLARADGLAVEVVTCAEGDPTTSDALRSRDEYAAAGGRIRVWEAAGEALLAHTDVIVDGLFGIGLARPPEGLAAELILAINASGRPVLALDLPSGLDADCGATPGACIDAALTVAFIGVKQGQLTGRAAAVQGTLVLEGLDIDGALRAEVAATVRVLHADELATALRPRARDAHKGRCGHVLLIGGDEGFAGAIRLAAEAAARSGAGLVSVATRSAHAALISAARPELMARGVEDARSLEPLIERCDVIAIGPGLGRGDWGRHLLSAAMASGKPLVVDADALNLLAALPRILPADAVLTPHPGEAARLDGCAVAEIERDRYAALSRLVKRFGCTVVLKGAGTLIARRESAVYVNPHANPGMASGGMGDVLTGVIAALRAQGLATLDAARLGVLAHAEAARRAACGGERGMLAGDVIAELRAVVNPRSA